MDFDKVIRQRKMIREYIANKQIPEELITRLIKNAYRAPSAGHTQVQEFIVVKDDITKKKLRRVAVNHEYVELAPVLIICSNTSRSTNRYGTHAKEFNGRTWNDMVKENSGKR
jgi:nitroreductase